MTCGHRLQVGLDDDGLLGELLGERLPVDVREKGMTTQGFAAVAPAAQPLARDDAQPVGDVALEDRGRGVQRDLLLLEVGAAAGVLAVEDALLLDEEGVAVSDREKVLQQYQKLQVLFLHQNYH